MMQENLNTLLENLPLLEPYFMGEHSLMEDAHTIGSFLHTISPIGRCSLARLAGRRESDCREVAGWNARTNTVESLLCKKMRSNLRSLINLLGEREVVGGSEVDALLGCAENESARLMAVRYDRRLCGVVCVVRDERDWGAFERVHIDQLWRILGVAFSNRNHKENEQLSSSVVNTMLNGMKCNIHVTDIENDRLLFMNETMKQEYGLENPEGEICWRVLQAGKDERCANCPKHALLNDPEGCAVYQSEEVSCVTGRTYRNYDSLVRWVDGSTVHLQQSFDVTELKSAYTDELTQMLTRRPGKEQLRGAVQRVRERGETACVCLYDVNALKQVNDQFGHAEGDRLLREIADAIREILGDGEFGFRLSGDEFVLFLRCGRWRASARLAQVIEQLAKYDRPYQSGFCYGLAEISAQNRLSAEEALSLADEQMYEQKRRHHIQHGTRLQGTQQDGQMPFTYDEKCLYGALSKSTDAYLFVCNMRTGVFRYPRAMVEEFALPGEVVENAAAVWGAMVHEDDRAAFLETNQEITDGRARAHCVEYRAKNRHGEWVWMRCRGHVETNERGEPEIFAGFLTNLGRRNKIDHLTGLFNKLELEDQVSHLREDAPDQTFGLMVFNIDDLKHVNDLYNRTFGDEVIRIVSQRLQSLLPSGGAVYRLDGDEFGVLVRGAGRETLEWLYRSVSHSFENQRELNGKKYYCTLSAGGVFFPQDADNYLDLMKYAGYALEHVKKSGKKNCAFYSKQILSSRSRALELVEVLREGVENDCSGFRLNLQPLVDAESGALNGFEALARFSCERFGEVSPVEFIPLLEQTGLIVPFGKWVFATAARIGRQCHLYKPDLKVSINLSYLQLEGDDFLDFMRQTLKELCYPPDRLVVELTESTFSSERERVQEIFEVIREMGVRIAMDDFGTGYSALGILKESPADIVKIDRIFLRDIQTSNFDATFIRFVVALCHDVGIQVCQEGVETEEEYHLVRSMGLDFIQGYLFGRPMSEQAFFERYLLGGKG